MYVKKWFNLEQQSVLLVFFSKVGVSTIQFTLYVRSLMQLPGFDDTIILIESTSEGKTHPTKYTPNKRSFLLWIKKIIKTYFRYLI